MAPRRPDALEVRIEPFETPATMGGGLCVVRGETLVLIDQRAPLPDRIRAPRSGADRTPERDRLHGTGGPGAHRGNRGRLEAPYRMSSRIELQSGPLSLLAARTKTPDSAVRKIIPPGIHMMSPPSC